MEKQRISAVTSVFTEPYFIFLTVSRQPLLFNYFHCFSTVLQLKNVTKNRIF